MNKRAEYVRVLSHSLKDENNAAFGLGQKYRDLSLHSSTSKELLDDVYNEIMTLYIQTEVSLMKAFVYKKGYPTIDQTMANTLEKDFESIFQAVRDYSVTITGTSDEFKLPTGKTAFVNYDDFKVIDSFNRKIGLDEATLFDELEKMIKASPHRLRIRELFLREK